MPDQLEYDSQDVTEDFSQPPKKNNLFKIILGVVIFLLIVGNGFTAYFLYTKSVDSNTNQSNNNSNNSNGLNLNNNLNNNNNNTNTNNNQITLQDGEILVAWNNQPVQVDFSTLFDSLSSFLIEIDFEQELVDYGFTLDQVIEDFKSYKIGTVEQGEYTGQDLYLVTYSPEGPSFRDIMFRVIKDGASPIILTNHSDELHDYYYEKIFGLDEETNIVNLEPTDTILVPDSDFILVKTEEEPFLLMSNYDNLRELYKYNDEDYLYKDEENGCFIVRANDGTIREYYFELDFLGEAGDAGQYAGMVPNLLDIVMNSGEQNNREYIFKKVGGCSGFSTCYNYSDYVENISQLFEVAQSRDGQEKFYVLRRDDNGRYDDQAYEILKEMYDLIHIIYDLEGNPINSGLTFDEFVGDNPLIYWQDPFGDFIEFSNASYLPAVECGKPVIYLYPEQETDVSVQVSPMGGLTITEPDYNDGWLVKAQPNGELYNYNDGKVYPYLFWEGFGLNYERPDEGFVIAQNEVESFLQEKLAQLGLIEKEYNEFLEFWLPKMTGSDYYFITFMPQADFDVLAPISINPQPDTIIRVFMDYEGLDEYVEVEPQEIVTPQRNGFVAVEWGGALHR